MVQLVLLIIHVGVWDLYFGGRGKHFLPILPESQIIYARIHASPENLFLLVRLKLYILVCQYLGRDTWDPTSYTRQNILTSKKKKSRPNHCQNSNQMLPNIAKIYQNLSKFRQNNSWFCFNQIHWHHRGGGGGGEGHSAPCPLPVSHTHMLLMIKSIPLQFWSFNMCTQFYAHRIPAA